MPPRPAPAASVDPIPPGSTLRRSMRNRNLRQIATAALLSAPLLLAGCKMMGPDFAAPTPHTPQPA